MRIRPATPADVPAIAAIVVDCDPVSSTGEYELRKAREATSSPTRRTFVAEVGAEVAGYVSVEVGDPETAHLSRLFVRPPHWGSGVAVALHAEALDAARGHAEITLFTPTANGRARRFYEREG